MDRRQFLKNGLRLAAGAAGFVAFSRADKLFAQIKKNDPILPPDLVAVKNGEPDIMFDRAIAAMGGMGNFVKKGQSVLVKPNIGWAVSPDRAANTNPLLVKRIIEHCYQAGAKKVVVFDHTCNDANRCYSESGIERAVKDAGGQMAPGNLEANYQAVKIPGGSLLKSTSVHELVLESDVFINVPVLKNHGSARLTMSMKNLMGVVWNRGWWHANGLHESIADFCLYRKPDLNILDAYAVMTQNGPRGTSMEDVKIMKNLLISRDMVAIDAAGVKLFGLEPSQIRHVVLANEKKIGTMDLSKLNIKRIVL
jgi:uncharacterized protein (DUF362 family)